MCLFWCNIFLCSLFIPKSISPGWVRTEILGRSMKTEDIEASKADYEKFVQYGNVSFVYIKLIHIMLSIGSLFTMPLPAIGHRFWEHSVLLVAGYICLVSFSHYNFSWFLNFKTFLFPWGTLINANFGNNVIHIAGCSELSLYALKNSQFWFCWFPFSCRFYCAN